MNDNLTCMQVSALINFYIENKLNPKLTRYVEFHLSKCPQCKKKVEELISVLEKYNELKKSNPKEQKEEINKEFIRNLSAYIDNELEDDDNIKIKKMAVSNPNARQELDAMYKFKKILQSSYNKTKRELKKDYSKSVIAIIRNESVYSTNYFYKIAIFCAFTLTIIGLGIIYLYF